MHIYSMDINKLQEPHGAILKLIMSHGALWCWMFCICFAVNWL